MIDLPRDRFLLVGDAGLVGALTGVESGNHQSAFPFLRSSLPPECQA